MSIFELRQIIESAIPWYLPLVFGVLLLISYLIYDRIK